MIKQLKKIIILILLVFFSLPSYSEAIKLKNGKAIDAEIIEKTDEYIKVDINDIVITHYLDEIESIDGERLVKSSYDKIASTGLESKRLLKKARIIASSNVFYEQLFNITLNSIRFLAPFIKKGIEYAADGNFQEAKNCFSSSKFKYSAQQFLNVIGQLEKGLITENYVLRYFKAINYLFNLQTKEAIEELTIAIEINPNSPLAYSLLGYAYGCSGYPKKGISYLNKALEIEPNFIEAYLYLGKIYGSELNQIRKAIAYFEKAIDLNPASVVPYSTFSAFYFYLKQPQQALIYSLKALEINPNYIGTHLELAQIYFSLQKHKEALAYALKCFQVMPENIASTFILVQLYEFLGRPQEAIPYLEKTLEINPNSSLTSLMYFGLGKIYWDLQQKEKAVKYYLKAWEFNQNDFLAPLILTSYYFSTKQYEQAIFFAKKLLELAPEKFEVPAESFFGFGSSESSSYNPIKVYGIIGGSYAALEQYQEAIFYLEEALRRGTNEGEIYRVLAYAYRQLGNYEKAYEIEKQAVEADPCLQ